MNEGYDSVPILSDEDRRRLGLDGASTGAGVDAGFVPLEPLTSGETREAAKTVLASEQVRLSEKIRELVDTHGDITPGLVEELEREFGQIIANLSSRITG